MVFICSMNRISLFACVFSDKNSKSHRNTTCDTSTSHRSASKERDGEKKNTFCYHGLWTEKLVHSINCCRHNTTHLTKSVGFKIKIFRKLPFILVGFHFDGSQTINPLLKYIWTSHVISLLFFAPKSNCVVLSVKLPIRIFHLVFGYLHKANLMAWSYQEHGFWSVEITIINPLQILTLKFKGINSIYLSMTHIHFPLVSCLLLLRWLLYESIGMMMTQNILLRKLK